MNRKVFLAIFRMKEFRDDVPGVHLVGRERGFLLLGLHWLCAGRVLGRNDQSNAVFFISLFLYLVFALFFSFLGIFLTSSHRLFVCRLRLHPLSSSLPIASLTFLLLPFCLHAYMHFYWCLHSFVRFCMSILYFLLSALFSFSGSVGL